MSLIKRLMFFAVFLVFAPTDCTALSEVKGGFTPSPNEKCPVCGMFVAKYPTWTCKIIFTDSSNSYFDGPKDLFTYNLNPGKYQKAHVQKSVSAIMAKDYYTLRVIDARKAFYVTGSDVNGPMGRELIPFEKIDDAQGFLHDHKGKQILRFDEVTAAVLKSLE